jgi:hypothetical protein
MGERSDQAQIVIGTLDRRQLRKGIIVRWGSAVAATAPNPRVPGTSLLGGGVEECNWVLGIWKAEGKTKCGFARDCRVSGAFCTGLFLRARV